MKLTIPASFGRNSRANVVFPDPLGPAMTKQRGRIWRRRPSVVTALYPPCQRLRWNRNLRKVTRSAHVDHFLIILWSLDSSSLYRRLLRESWRTVLPVKRTRIGNPYLSALAAELGVFAVNMVALGAIHSSMHGKVLIMGSHLRAAAASFLSSVSNSQ